MGKAKRVVLASLAGVTGFLLVLSGLNLVSMSQTLNLYTGIVLLVMAVALYLLP